MVATAHDAPPGPYPLGAWSAPAAPLVRIPLDLAYRSPSFSDPVAVPTEVAEPLVLGVAEEVLHAELPGEAPGALPEAGPGAGSPRGYGLLQK